MQWIFVETPFFSKRRDEYFANDEAFRQFQLDLMKDPEKGEPIPEGAGIRKIREGDTVRRKGKRGGFRVIYLQIPETHEIYLLHIYPKTVKENLRRDEVKDLAVVARQVKLHTMESRRSSK